MKRFFFILIVFLYFIPFCYADGEFVSIGETSNFLDNQYSSVKQKTYQGTQEPILLQQLANNNQDVITISTTKDISMADKKDEKGKTIKKVDFLRNEAISEAGLTLGYQAGVQWKYEQIKKQLKKFTKQLDLIYDFTPFLLYTKNGISVLPPVIAEAKNGIQFSNKKTVTSKVAYQIIKKSRIVSANPSWREYLLKTYGKIETVNELLLPKTPQEHLLWSKSVHKGWNKGVSQAIDLYHYNLNTLTRDYKGLIQFSLLAAQHIVSLPYLAEGDLGININGKKMDVDQKVFRITKVVKFNHVKQWSPIPAFNIPH